ncbi:hypothetical protein JKP88DRAFT_244916 [Tribonema minus]|uniref:Uncharacterized protein n=1 Tax=Tribonema minus TaxID=303371 RepID=A0A836CHN2_9STRA|nr:hypothetical protein JKP88DRAFT_244916 [Tribonema minus]
MSTVPESHARLIMSLMPDDSVPRKMLFPSPRFLVQPWPQRYLSVIKCDRHWELLSQYATGTRWLKLEDADAVLFDFWLLDWFDYAAWLKSAATPQDIEGVFYIPKCAKRRKITSTQALEQVYMSLDKQVLQLLASEATSMCLGAKAPHERKWLHVRAEQAALVSESDGDEYMSKTITLTKPENWKLPSLPQLSRLQRLMLEQQANRESGNCIFSAACGLGQSMRDEEYYKQYYCLCDDMEC